VTGIAKAARAEGDFEGVRSALPLECGARRWRFARRLFVRRRNAATSVDLVMIGTKSDISVSSVSVHPIGAMASCPR
jgi:hypothetical protein